MDGVSVTSRTIAKVRYEDKASTLEIQFQSGLVYRYFNVPRSVYDGLLQADSKGKYFNAEIKNKYKFIKL